MSYVKTQSKGKPPTNPEEYSSQMSDTEGSDVSQEEPSTFDIIRKYFDVKFSEIAECTVTKDCIDSFFAKLEEQERESLSLNIELWYGCPFWSN